MKNENSFLSLAAMAAAVCAYFGVDVLSLGGSPESIVASHMLRPADRVRLAWCARDARESGMLITYASDGYSYEFERVAFDERRMRRARMYLRELFREMEHGIVMNGSRA